MFIFIGLVDFFTSVMLNSGAIMITFPCFTPKKFAPHIWLVVCCFVNHIQALFFWQLNHVAHPSSASLFLFLHEEAICWSFLWITNIYLSILVTYLVFPKQFCSEFEQCWLFIFIKGFHCLPHKPSIISQPLSMIMSLFIYSVGGMH